MHCSQRKDRHETIAFPILLIYYSYVEDGLQGALKSHTCPCLCLINKLNTVIDEGETRKDYCILQNSDTSQQECRYLHSRSHSD